MDPLIGASFTASFFAGVAALFAPVKYFFWWFSAPAIGLFFLAR